MREGTLHGWAMTEGEAGGTSRADAGPDCAPRCACGDEPRADLRSGLWPSAETGVTTRREKKDSLRVRLENARGNFTNS